MDLKRTLMSSLERARDAGRKYGITLVMLYQSEGQLCQQWGEGGKAAWFECASWRAYAAIGSLEQARAVSEACGEHGVHAAPDRPRDLQAIPADSVGGFVYDGGPVPLNDLSAKGVRYAGLTGLELQGWLKVTAAGRTQLAVEYRHHRRQCGHSALLPRDRLARGPSHRRRDRPDCVARARGENHRPDPRRRSATRPLPRPAMDRLHPRPRSQAQRQGPHQKPRGRELAAHNDRRPAPSGRIDAERQIGRLLDRNSHVGKCGS